MQVLELARKPPLVVTPILLVTSKRRLLQDQVSGLSQVISKSVIALLVASVMPLLNRLALKESTVRPVLLLRQLPLLA